MTKYEQKKAHLFSCKTNIALYNKAGCGTEKHVVYCKDWLHGSLRGRNNLELVSIVTSWRADFQKKVIFTNSLLKSNLWRESPMTELTRKPKWIILYIKNRCVMAWQLRILSNNYSKQEYLPSDLNLLFQLSLCFTWPFSLFFPSGFCPFLECWSKKSWSLCRWQICGEPSVRAFCKRI